MNEYGQVKGMFADKLNGVDRREGDTLMAPVTAAFNKRLTSEIVCLSCSCYCALVPVAKLSPRPLTLLLMSCTLPLIESRNSVPLDGASSMPAPTPTPTPA